MLTVDKIKERRPYTHTLIAHYQLIQAYFKLNLSASMEYRSSFLIQVFGMFLNNLSFAFFWWLLFQKFETIGTYDYGQVMLLWAFSSSGFGLCFILFGNIRSIVDLVVKGELDTYLLQPKNVLINTISAKTIVSAWGDFTYGIILFIVVQGISLKGLLMFITFTTTAALILASVIITYNSLAFYFGNIQSLSGLVLEFIITFSIYPADMFQGFVRMVLFTALPAGFISMVPVRLIENFELSWFFILIGITIMWVGIAFFVFYKGLKHYESGNLMVQRM